LAQAAPRGKMRLNAVFTVYLLPAARLRAGLRVGVAEAEFLEAASVPGPDRLSDTEIIENAPVAYVKFGPHAGKAKMVNLGHHLRQPSGEKSAAPTSGKVAAPAKKQAQASIHGRTVGPSAEATGALDDDDDDDDDDDAPLSMIQLSSSKANESDVVASAPPADLAAMLAKLDNISAEVQATELATVALQTKVNTAESQISQNAVSLEEAYQALHTMEAQKTNNSFNINLMEQSSEEVQRELQVQGTKLTNLTGEVGNLEVNVASIDPAAQDLGGKAKEVSEKVMSDIPALDNVTSRLDHIETAISGLEERMNTEGVVGPVKEDMDALANDVSTQVLDLDDIVQKHGIPRRLIIKDPTQLLR